MDELGLKYGRFAAVKKCECKHNGAVSCEDTARCSRCGWNPAVAARRTEAIRMAMARETPEWFIGSGPFDNIERR